jgi:hypothetical protein
MPMTPAEFGNLPVTSSSARTGATNAAATPRQMPGSVSLVFTSRERFQIGWEAAPE